MILRNISTYVLIPVLKVPPNGSILPGAGTDGAGTDGAGTDGAGAGVPTE